MKQQITISSYDARIYVQVLDVYIASFVDFDQAPYYIQAMKALAEELRLKFAKKGLEEREKLSMKITHAQTILMRKVCSVAPKDNDDTSILQSLRLITTQTDRLLVG